MRTACLALALGIAACGSDGATPDAGLPGFQSPDAGEIADAATTGTMVGTLGALPYDGGTSFRVWAPGAEQVFVSGDFNQWSGDANPLAPESGGVFAAEVAGAAPGQTYRYLIHRGTDVLERNDPRARQMVSAKGPSVIVDSRYAWQVPAFAPPPVDKQVIYELHLGTFNPPAGTVQGTFATAVDKLDYLRDLGINMIELMPPMQFPTTTSWGYSTNQAFAVAGAYGTPDELRRFVDEAHARGMGVIVDLVHNHYSGRDLVVDCFDGACNPGAGDRGIYFYSDAARAKTPWGPRPNFGRAEVSDFIRDNALMWLAEYRCDGFRWDSTSNIRGLNNGATVNADGQKLLIDLMNGLHAQFPQAIEIAEDLATLDSVTKPTAKGGLGFDSQWDAAFFHPIDDTVIAANDADRKMSAIRDAIVHRYNGAPLQRVVYSEDHDEVANGRSRIPEMISPGNAGSLAARQRSTVAAAVVLTSPGVPMIFMGQEFLENGHFSDTVALDWTKTGTYAGILQEYKDLIALRKNVAGNTVGLTGDAVNVFHVNEAAKVIAYHRWKKGGAGDDVVVVANFSAKPFTGYILGLPRAGTWHVRFSSDAAVYSPDYAATATPDLQTIATTRDGFAQQATLTLGAYQAVILSQ